MLGATPRQVYGEFDQELARRRRRREQGRQLGHPVPAGHHELDEPGITTTRTCWCHFRVNMSGLFKFGRLVYLIA